MLKQLGLTVSTGWATRGMQAQERLLYVERTLPQLNLQQDHINNINTVLYRNKDKLEVLKARQAGAAVGAPLR